MPNHRAPVAALAGRWCLLERLDGKTVEDVLDHAYAAVRHAGIESHVGAAAWQCGRVVLRMKRRRPGAVFDERIAVRLDVRRLNHETLHADVGEESREPGTDGRHALDGRLSRGEKGPIRCNLGGHP